MNVINLKYVVAPLNQYMKWIAFPLRSKSTVYARRYATLNLVGIPYIV